MEKIYQLDQKEAVLLGQLDQERTQALAMIGALSLDMEAARKNLDTAAERQRGFLRQALIARNVERYENARVQNGSIVVSLPDNAAASVIDMKPLDRPVNGAAADLKE